MAELEIHHEHEGSAPDPFGLNVGILTSVLAVFLAIVTIASHRAHTNGVLIKADVNDKWNFYQAKRIKLHNVELGEELISLTAPKGEATDKVLTRLKSEGKRYQDESKDEQEKAEAMEHKVEQAEDRALRYDVGEGLLEIGLVLSSLYFIAKKKFFPALGLAAGICGLVAAVAGMLI